jgi:hypothetical protein
LTYEKYEKDMKDELTELIINNELIETKKYIFAKKTAYIVTAKAYGFDDDNIKQKLNTINVKKYIIMSENNIFNKKVKKDNKKKDKEKNKKKDKEDNKKKDKENNKKKDKKNNKKKIENINKIIIFF